MSFKAVFIVLYFYYRLFYTIYIPLHSLRKSSMQLWKTDIGITSFYQHKSQPKLLKKLFWNRIYARVYVQPVIQWYTLRKRRWECSGHYAWEYCHTTIHSPCGGTPQQSTTDRVSILIDGLPPEAFWRLGKPLQVLSDPHNAPRQVTTSK